MARQLSMATVAIVLIWTVPATASILVSNLSSPNSATPTVGDNDGDVRRAGDFTTGSNVAGYDLTSVTMLFTVDTGETPDPTFQLDLFTNAAGVPGSSIIAFSGSNSPIDGLFTCTGSTVLAPNTKYWLVSSAPQILGSFKNFRHFSTVDDGEVSSDGWTIGDVGASHEFGSWGPLFNSQQLKFSVDANVIPEPSSIAVLAMALLGFFPSWHGHKRSSNSSIRNKTPDRR